MLTRSEYRSQQASEPSEETKQVQPKRVHHFASILLGIIALTILVVSVLANLTVLNADFAVQEINDSVVEDELTNQIGAGLAQYGISSQILTTKTTKQLTSQVVKQVYAGKKIDLDLRPVIQSAATSVNGLLAQYGISTNAAETSSATTAINSAVNAQLNTSVVTSFTQGLQVTKTIVNLALVISAGIIVIMAVVTMLRRSFLHDFSWICLWGLLVSWGLIRALSSLIMQVAKDQPDYVALISHVMTAIMHQANSLFVILLLVVVVLFAGRLWRQIR